MSAAPARPAPPAAKPQLPAVEPQEAPQLPAAPTKSSIAVVSKQSNAGLQLTSYDDVIRVAQLYEKSGTLKDSAGTAMAAVKILAGMEMGLSPAASMNGLYVGPGGSIGARAELLKDRIAGSGIYSYKTVERSAEIVAVQFYVNGEIPNDPPYHGLVTRFFFHPTIDHPFFDQFKKANPDWKKDPQKLLALAQSAQNAGLLDGRNKNTWFSYKENMLFKWCIQDGARFYCPGLFGGMTVHVVDSDQELNGIVTDAPRSDYQVVSGEAERVAQERSAEDEATTVEVRTTDRLEAAARVNERQGNSEQAEQLREAAKTFAQLTPPQIAELTGAYSSSGWQPGQFFAEIERQFGLTRENWKKTMTAEQYAKALQFFQNTKPAAH